MGDEQCAYIRDKFYFQRDVYIPRGVRNHSPNIMHTFCQQAIRQSGLLLYYSVRLSISSIIVFMTQFSVSQNVGNSLHACMLTPTLLRFALDVTWSSQVYIYTQVITLKGIISSLILEVGLFLSDFG